LPERGRRRVNTRSLKFRLVVWYAGLLTLLFVVFGVFVYASLSHYLKEGLREALTRRARQVAEMTQRVGADWARLDREIQSSFAPEANNRLTRVTYSGVVRYASGIPADHSFNPRTIPPPPAGAADGYFERRVAKDDTVLFVTVLVRDNGKLVIEEGSAEAPIRTTLHAWLAVLVSGLALLVVGAVLGGYFLAQRALQPVDRIIRSAERISSSNLSERLPVPNTRDELERLSNSLNEMIRRLEENFQHTQRFLTDASHELRTPLTMVRGELETIIERPGSDPEVRELAGSALEEVERLKRIVEGLFALTRLDAGEALEPWSVFDLGELASTTADQMCLLAEDKGIAIHCNEAGKALVRGDRARLKQVMVNLLDNAIKYTPADGRINVLVAARDGKAVLEVSDNGSGIPAAAIGRVFERFFRVDKARSREQGGAGLGLSIVKSICVAHGGAVAVQSEEGRGTRFVVELPLAD